MTHATRMVALTVSGFRSIVQSRRRRRVLTGVVIMTPSFSVGPGAHHPQRTVLTWGLHPTETETDGFTHCIDPIGVFPIGSASPAHSPPPLDDRARMKRWRDEPSARQSHLALNLKTLFRFTHPVCGNGVEPRQPL